jgi:two-component system, cell cycle response regulator CpdR
MPSESILILDDEDDIVSLLKRTLELDEFSVFGFTNPLLALEHFRTNAAKYGLVLADIHMPQMNGIEFAAEIRKLNPAVKILLMSAFDTSDLNIEQSLQIAELLQKLLSPMKMRSIVVKHLSANMH